MIQWIPTRYVDKLPMEGEKVIARFPPNGDEIEVALEVNEYSETVWTTDDGRQALISDFTEHEKSKYGISTMPDLPAPTHWRAK